MKSCSENFWEIPRKSFFFSIRVFFHRHWRFTGQQGTGGDHRLFHSTTSTRSRTFRHLFATLHVRWLSRIFNCKSCVYQTATRWDLSPYRTTIRWQKFRRKNISNWVIFESNLWSFGYFECSTALWVILDPSCKSNLLKSLLGASGSDSHLTPKTGHLQKNGSCVHILDTTLVVEGKQFLTQI